MQTMKAVSLLCRVVLVMHTIAALFLQMVAMEIGGLPPNHYQQLLGIIT
jgi:hypothetical protein